MKTIKKENNVVISQTKNFETILIRLTFPFYLKEKDVGKSEILSYLLTQSCSKLNEEQLENYKSENYIYDFYSNVEKIGRSGFLNFYIEFINPKVINENNLVKVLDLLFNCLYEPNLINNEFAEHEVENIKNKIIINYKNSKKTLKGYINWKTTEIIDEHKILTLTPAYYEEQFQNYTTKDLYLYYLDIIKTKIPFAFILGNVQNLDIEHLVNSYFNKDNLKISYIQDYYYYLNYQENKIIKETQNFNQSALALVYKTENMTKKDNYLLNTIGYLLQSSSEGILYKNLRTLKGLVYSFDSFISLSNGTLQIRIYTDKDKLELALATVKDTLRYLENKDNLELLISNLKNKLRINLIRNKDNNYIYLNNMVDKFFQKRINSNTLLKMLEKISLEDISNLVKRLKLDTCFYIIGEKK